MIISSPVLVMIESSKILSVPTIGNLLALRPLTVMLLPKVILELTETFPSTTTVFEPSSST